MRILVRGTNLGRFRAACAEFGTWVDSNQSMNVWFGPDDLDTLYEFVMPEHSPLATWVAMKHPEWLHEIWQQGPPVIVDDSEETFLKLQTRPHGQH